MTVFKIALVQYRAAPNGIHENIVMGTECIRRAKDMGADLVLFPEMWSNGYAPPFLEAFDAPDDLRFEFERQVWLASAVPENSPFIHSFQQAAAENQIGVVITYLACGNKSPYNRAAVIDRNGHILMTYDKVHTCDFSMESLLESGNEFKVCSFDGIRIGVMICFDREFPESARILMLKGAEIILVPNACPMNPPRLNQLAARAFENMVGIAMANYPGKDEGQSVAFHPQVFASDGQYRDNTVFKAPAAEENIFIVSFDMDELRSYAQSEVWGNKYRKAKTYGILTE